MITTVRIATIAWAVAVAAGVIESVLSLVNTAGSGPLGPGVWTDVGVRVVVYGLATVLVFNFARGRRWARTVLTLLLTVIGLASLLGPAAMALIGGQTFTAAFGDGGKLGWAFIVVRLVHIACVVVASVLMFTPSANAYFAVTGRRPPAVVAAVREE
ncbi:MAG: hypothetical protein JWR37_1903 [Mycobacterium sp.]|nr:hypothetical protein [Mycobacterium sp.]